MSTEDEEKEKKNSKRNPLFVPMIISLCINVILVIAIIVMAMQMVAVSTSALSASSSDSEEEEEGTYYFTDYNDEEIEITSYSSYYVEGEYICAGDATNWVFTYDESTEINSVDISEEDGTEVGSYDLYFYLTEDNENLVINLLNPEDEEDSYIYYLITILDDEESNTAIGLYFENAVQEDDGFVLYTPDAYEEYIVNAEDEDTTEDEETEDTETSDDAEDTTEDTESEE